MMTKWDTIQADVADAYSYLDEVTDEAPADDFDDFDDSDDEEDEDDSDDSEEEETEEEYFGIDIISLDELSNTELEELEII